MAKKGAKVDGKRRQKANKVEERPPAQEAGTRQAQGGSARGSAQVEAPTYSVLGIDHVHVTAPTELLDDVIEWYRNSLRLQELDKPEGTRPEGAWFLAGSQEVHLSVDEHNPPKTAHFGIVVDDHEAVLEALREAGCHIEQATKIPGRFRFYTRDPAGNRLEIVHYTDAEVVVVEHGKGEMRAKVLHEEK
ncbi:MAG TPA: VOC family protein [Actinomycetota bacterium]|nr:VOC family protein [Actinomycetota bacterium]